MKDKTILIAVFLWMWLLVVIASNKSNNEELTEINIKLDNLASQTDANLNELTNNFEEYKNNNREVIDSINTQLNEHKENMQDEIHRIDDDIEGVRQSKLEKKQYLEQKQYQNTSKTTYAVSTNGLNSCNGVNDFNGHRETYYNLNMNNVVNNAQNNGLYGEYWVREDGCKMFGDKIIVAANQELYPYGSTVETSLGEGIVLDTGTFIYQHPDGFDIATEW